MRLRTWSALLGDAGNLSGEPTHVHTSTRMETTESVR
jgi:hypothetical protein